MSPTFTVFIHVGRSIDEEIGGDQQVPEAERVAQRLVIKRRIGKANLRNAHLPVVIAVNIVHNGSDGSRRLAMLSNLSRGGRVQLEPARMQSLFVEHRLSDFRHAQSPPRGPKGRQHWISPRGAFLAAVGDCSADYWSAAI